jgi:tetratricopeptide (TPR) repeat protein
MRNRPSGDQTARPRKTAATSARSVATRQRPAAASALDPRWLCALAVLLSVLVYLRTVDFPFVYDDLAQIVSNSHIQSWHYLPQYFTQHLWSQMGEDLPNNYYRPFFLLWMLLNFKLFGAQPVGWHIAAILLHAAVTWAVYLIAGRELKDRLAAGIAAILFAVHPVHVEAVAWVSGINEPEFVLFALLSVLCYLRWRDGDGRKWLAFSLLSFSFSLLSKETAIVLPAMILFYEWRRLRQLWPAAPIGARIQVIAPVVAGYAALDLAYLAIRTLALKGIAPNIGNHASALSVALSFPSATWFYLSKLLWPTSLSVFYSFAFVTRPSLLNFALPLLGLLAVAAALGWCARRVTGVAAACLWLMIPLLPPLLALARFDLRDLVHDRYLYLPCMGFAMLVALLLRRLSFGSRKLFRLPLAQAAAVFLLTSALAAATVVQSQYWSSDLALYRRGVQIAPRNPLALDQLAKLLSNQQDYDDAAQYFARALEADPDDYRTLMSLGVMLSYQNDYDRAIPYLQRAIQLHPSSGMPYFFLGVSQLGRKQLPEAESSFRRAIQLVPGKSRQHYALGLVLEEQGRLPEARSEFLAELKVDPNSTDAPQKLEDIQSRLDTVTPTFHKSP